MDSIAEKLAEIEHTARAIVEEAESQKSNVELEMQKKRDDFDAEQEALTTEKIQLIHEDLERNKEALIAKQSDQSSSAIAQLKEDFKEHHTEYAQKILEQITEVTEV